MFAVSGSAPFPAYYNIGVVDEGRTVVIDIPLSTWEQLPVLCRSNGYRELIKKWLRISDFIFPGALPWGYGPIFSDETSPRTDWHRIRCELPCFTDSNGQMIENGHLRGREIVGSLWFLIKCLESLQTEKPAMTSLQQSLELTVSARVDDGVSYAIGAGVSNACCDWIVAHHQHEETATISRYMQNAYCRMFGLEKMERYDAQKCHADIRPDCSFSLEVPGDRTGMGTYTNHRGQFGVDMYDHNVDTSMQLLALLVGLATLNTFVIESEKV